MKKITIAIFLAAFFLLRPYAVQENGIWYTGDDADYFAQSSWIVFGQYPSYKHEYYTTMPQGPQRSVGPGILAAPFVFLFSFFDRWEGSNISVERTYKNIAGSWSLFGFIVSSVFYLCSGCLFLYWACLYAAKPWAASWAVIFMVICQGLPLYAFRRPVFCHAAEFFLQSLMMYLFLRNAKTKGGFLDHWVKYASVGALAAMIFLVRYNNIIIALVWPLLLLAQRRAHGLGEWCRRLLWVAVPFIALVVLFKVWPEIYNNNHPYSDAFGHIRVHAGMADILKRFLHVFFGIDWGMVFTAPFLLLGVFALVKYDMPFKRGLCLVALPLLINFYTIILFGTQGGWYGYRFLIVSAFPVFTVPLAVLLERWSGRYGRKILLLLVLFALPPVLSMWCFEGNANNLTLHLIPQFFGRTDWSNDTYQLSVWKTVTNLHGVSQTLFKGGGYYVLYLLSVVKFLPHQIINYMNFSVKYPYFEWKVLARTLIIYILPLLMWLVCPKKLTASAIDDEIENPL